MPLCTKLIAATGRTQKPEHGGEDCWFIYSIRYKWRVAVAYQLAAAGRLVSRGGIKDSDGLERHPGQLLSLVPLGLCLIGSALPRPAQQLQPNVTFVPAFPNPVHAATALHQTIRASLYLIRSAIPLNFGIQGVGRLSRQSNASLCLIGSALPLKPLSTY